MAVVALSRDAGEARLSRGKGDVEVAGANAPTSTIVSGDRGAVETLVAEWESEGVFARRLDVDFASHCFHMDPLLDEFREAIRDLNPRPARIPFDSTVDGEPSVGSGGGTDSTQLLDPAYWVRPRLLLQH